MMKILETIGMFLSIPAALIAMCLIGAVVWFFWDASKESRNSIIQSEFVKKYNVKELTWIFLGFFIGYQCHASYN